MPEQNKRVIQVVNVKKSYGEGKVLALRGINLEVEASCFIALAGPSGSGKTTLLNIVGGLDVADDGEVILEGKSLQNLDEIELTRIRSEKIGFIFQQFNLIPVLTARENVELPLEILPGLNKNKRQEMADRMLSLVELGSMGDRYPRQLSGGQQQRVAIARALVKDPAIVLADEPTANLDGETGVRIVELMKKMREELGTAFILSTHDTRVFDLTDSVIKMEDGLIIS